MTKNQKGILSSLSNALRFTSVVKVNSNLALEEAVRRIGQSAGSSRWFGGYTYQAKVQTSPTPKGDYRFEYAFYRNRRRTRYLAQSIRGVVFKDAQGTQVVGKVQFTWGAMQWVILALLLVVVSVFLLLFTGNIVMWALVGLTGSFFLVALFQVWYDRRNLIGILRRAVRA